MLSIELSLPHCFDQPMTIYGNVRISLVSLSRAMHMSVHLLYAILLPFF